MTHKYTIGVSGKREEWVHALISVEAESLDEARKKIEEIFYSDRNDRKIDWKHTCSSLVMDRKICNCVEMDGVDLR